MSQIRIVLVGTDAISRQRITRMLEWYHGFTGIPMIGGINKILSDMYNTPTNKFHPTTKYKMYDALYAIDNDIFIRYMDRRLEKSRKNIVIYDPRYTHEVIELEKRGFIIVRVVPDGKERKIGSYIKGANPGTVSLYEWFPGKTKGYKAAYSIRYSYEDKDINALVVDTLIENLKFHNTIPYNMVEPQKEGDYIEEEISAPDKTND